MSRHLITNLRGAITADPVRPWTVHRIDQPAIAVERDHIAWIGPRAEVPAAWRDVAQHDARGAWAAPGFVDPHTHLLFGGERAGELNRRLHGATYAQIAAEGGGIRATVAATRALSVDDLVEIGEQRLRTLAERGVVHIEAKTGYGLEIEAEARLLEAYARLRARGHGLDVTLLLAHAVPPELDGDAAAYTEIIAEHWMPELARRFPDILRFCDAFVESGAFTVEQGRRIFMAGRRVGLRPRLHADQMSFTGGAELAAEQGAASADHLTYCSDAGAAAMAAAAVTPVLIPTATLFLGMRDWAPARRLIEAGCLVALASDFNPGTTPCLDPLLVFRLGCLELRMTFEEAFTAMTLHPARSLDRPALGHLFPGASSRILLWDVADPLDLIYWIGEPFRPRLVDLSPPPVGRVDRYGAQGLGAKR